MSNNFLSASHLFQELLQEHPGVFYIDTSIRFHTPYNDEHYNQARLFGGFLFNSFTGHSTFPVTHPGVYDYLPSNMTALKTLNQWEGGDILVYRTERICKAVLMPLIMCLLNEKCAQPTLNNGCYIKSWDEFANCHRFDQSLMNILVQNHVGYNNSLRASPEVVYVHRNGIGDVNPDQPEVCTQ